MIFFEKIFFYLKYCLTKNYMPTENYMITILKKTICFYAFYMLYAFIRQNKPIDQSNAYFGRLC